MKLDNSRYSQFAIVKEMLETPSVVRDLPIAQLKERFRHAEHTLFTGEGSSWIFPGKRAVDAALCGGRFGAFRAESASNALSYPLDGCQLFVASNSGKTAECVALIRALRERSFGGTIFGVSAHDGTPVVQESDASYILSCGPEQAVAATKSVVEQALVYDILFRTHSGASLPDLDRLADELHTVLSSEPPAEIVQAIVSAPVIYFAGRNDGVAEELALKANEIARAKSGFLPGTYAVHGIEEVMSPEDALIWIDPPAEHQAKFRTVLAEGVGLNIFAISSRETSFPTFALPTPADPETGPYLQLAAGWNLLVEAGISAGLNIDKPERARKVGNEVDTP